MDERKRAMGLISSVRRKNISETPNRTKPPATRQHAVTRLPTIGASANTSAKDSKSTTILTTPVSTKVTTSKVKTKVNLLTASSCKPLRRNSPYRFRLEINLAMISTLWSLENTWFKLYSDAALSSSAMSSTKLSSSLPLSLMPRLRIASAMRERISSPFSGAKRIPQAAPTAAPPKKAARML